MKNAPKIIVNILALIGILVFVGLSIDFTSRTLSVFNTCKSDKVDGQNCLLPSTRGVTESTLSGLGTAITVIVGGFLGIVGWEWKTQVLAHNNSPFQTALNSSGGGMNWLGWARLILSLGFIAILIFGLYATYLIELGYPLENLSRASIEAPAFLKQLANTGIGLLVGAIAVVGETATKN